MIGRAYDLDGAWRYYVWWLQLGGVTDGVIVEHHGRLFIFMHPTEPWGTFHEPLTTSQGRARRGTAEQDTLSPAVRAYAVTLGALAA